jgi:hypothetical protein
MEAFRQRIQGLENLEAFIELRGVGWRSFSLG